MDNPLLIMPDPKIIDRDLGQPDRRQVKFPSLTTQQKRVQPKLESALQQLKEKNIQVASNPDGLVPEKILVIELKKFDQEIKKKLVEIAGFEWMFDYSEDTGEDEDFRIEYPNGDIEEVNSHFYISMANLASLKKLKSLWDTYCKNGGQLSGDVGKFKLLFQYLKDIRFWDTKDRLRNTGLYDDLEFKIENQVPEIIIEIELWPRKTQSLNDEAFIRVKNNVEAFGGEIVSSCLIDSIGYSAVLAKFPTVNVKQFYLANKNDIALLTNDDVMHFNPTSQCAIEVEDVEELEEAEVNAEVSVEQDALVVALLDGYPLQQHTAIKDSLIIDDPDDFAEHYESHHRIHGTSMASIIINGDASDGKLSKIGKVYCRPVMVPQQVPDIDGKRVEIIPEEQLPVDIIHRSVRRMFEGDGKLPPQANTVKIINLSIGDLRKRFEGRISPLAKLIDWLSWKYNVLFVVSAGNYYKKINLELTNKDYQAQNDEEKIAQTVGAIRKSLFEKRLLSPAESINALTVGALHADESGYTLIGDQVEPVKVGEMPSPINATSWGVKKSIKPDVLMPGGRLIYRNKAMTDGSNVELEPILNTAAPFGIKSAMPGTKGSLNAFGYTAGTSNATALATRKAAMVYETLSDLEKVAGNSLNKAHTSTIIKGLMIHGAELQGMDLKHYEEDNVNIRKYHISKYSGHGKLDMDRAHGCYGHQATLIRSGTFQSDKGHVHSIPLPDCLSGTNHLRRLIITLCWLTPINYSSQKYRGVKLWFAPDNKPSSEGNPLKVKDRELNHSQVRNGTVQHEILVGDKGMAYAKDKELSIKVNCMNDGLDMDGSFEIPYTLIVTVETPTANLPIYEEVQAKLKLMEKAKVKV